jgi:hypothetical protein
MFFANLFKLIFFMIAIYFFYSVFRMLLFSLRNSRTDDDERRRMEARERVKAREKRGRAAKGDEVIELDKNQYKVE